LAVQQKNNQTRIFLIFRKELICFNLGLNIELKVYYQQTFKRFSTRVCGFCFFFSDVPFCLGAKPEKVLFIYINSN